MPLDEPVTPHCSDLRQRLAGLRAGKPGIRNRDAAEILGVTEAELIAAGLGEKTIRLQPDWPGLFARLPKLGRVMALTRNETTVHERRGTYSQARFDNHVGLVLGPEIDLRIFLKSWRFMFAVEEESRRGILRSLQIFDRRGTAIHKIYAEETTDTAAWNALIGDLRAPIQSVQLDLEAAEAKSAPRADAEIDAPALLEGWADLKDTHDFVPLLMKHKARPDQAFRLAEGRFAWRLGPATARRLLETAAARAVPIMVFVGNPGIIQIHSGPVQRIQAVGDWLNVLDPDFNLHLRADKVAQAWKVEKPTSDGIVTSVELFDDAGERMATFFGLRKPGRPELQAWRDLVKDLTE
jgi:putative hemin transport protein